MHGICLAQNASIALRQAFSIWLKFCKPVNSKAIRTIFWTGCLLREYSKDCSIKLNLLPHLKAQAILISDGKPLALQHLKYLHVPQRTHKLSRHLGVLHLPKALSACRRPCLPSPSLLAHPPLHLLSSGGETTRSATAVAGAHRRSVWGRSGSFLPSCSATFLLGFSLFCPTLPASPVSGLGSHPLPFLPCLTTAACQCPYLWWQTGASPDSESCTKNSNQAPRKPSCRLLHQRVQPFSWSQTRQECSACQPSLDRTMWWSPLLQLHVLW